MYGNSIFTLEEHALTDGGYPDQIYVRPNWYILYMKNLSWLISEKFKLDNSKLDTKIFSQMVVFVTKNKCSMKGIIDYEIAKKIGKKVFYVPVFFSDGRALATVDGVFISDYLQVSKDIVENTKKYLIEQGISENNIKVEEIKGVERKININGVFDIEAFKITVN